MTYNYKARLFYGTFYTRKDRHHKRPDYFLSHYVKKPSREEAQRQFRNRLKRGDILPSTPGEYKRWCEVAWHVV